MNSNFIQVINLMKTFNKKTFFLILFLSSFIFRLPTFFNDYYDVDELAAIIQTKEHFAGNYVSESKKYIYHAIFKSAYKLSPENGWVLIHIATAFIVFATSVFIYLSGKLMNKENAGKISAFLYAILISSFNRHFMATNGEIIYNLPLAAGIFFLAWTLISIFDKEYLKTIISIPGFLICSYIALNIKFHGIILVIISIFFIFIYLPYLKLSRSNLLKYYFSISFLGTIFIVLDIVFLNTFISKFLSIMDAKLFYSFSARSMNPLYILIKFIHRQGLLTIWHFILWIPVFFYLKNVILSKRLKLGISESLYLTYFVLTYLMVFGGGSRLYFHYFMAPYPAACLLAGVALTSNTFKFKKLQNNIVKYLMIPGLFFLSWNTKDIIIKHFLPQAYYNEGKVLYWTRAVLVGTFDDYLLPETSYDEAAAYLKEISKKNDKLFVWGNGPYLYYFSGLRMATTTLWPQNTLLKIKRAYSQGNIKHGKQLENRFLDIIKSHNPIYFADTSGSKLSKTSKFHLKPEEFEILNSYFKLNFRFIHEVDGIKIYKKIE